MSLKIIVTGGSGFIGTNLVELFKSQHYEVYNFDLVPPRNKQHLSNWIQLDVRDYNVLKGRVLEIAPDYIVHLAARTDLNESKNIDGYNTNIQGVENIMDICSAQSSVKRILIASSMLVCKLGYTPLDDDDYCPNTLYGESKVLTEKIVKKYSCNWVLVRPTSIWGPWFDEPYANFFKLVLEGYYVNLPINQAATKTYGYVMNTVNQIQKILFADNDQVSYKCFYLGDSMPINIAQWANLIRLVSGRRKLITLTPLFFILLAKFGDFVNYVLGKNKFPMNTFRYRNMTTNQIINLEKTASVVGSELYKDLKKNTLETINWYTQYLKDR